MRGTALLFPLLAVAVVAVLCFAVPCEADDPTFCASWSEETVECHCRVHSCKRCYTRGCEFKFHCSHSHDSCPASECWCGYRGSREPHRALRSWARPEGLCNCCRKQSKSEAYSCDCVTTCDSCTRTVCSRLVTYRVDSLLPPAAEAGAETAVLVQGGTFADSHNITCRFGLTLSPGQYVDEETVRCVTPASAAPADVAFALSLDGGASWTADVVPFSFFECDGNCSGHGRCVGDRVCECDEGHFGARCDGACPTAATGGQPCTERAAPPPDGCPTEGDGACECLREFAGPNCTEPCACAPHGRCLPGGDARCACDPGRAGAQCGSACPDGCDTNGACEQERNGLCTCGLGWWGEACDRPCNCSGHGSCAQASGRCECFSGFWGERCDGECPRGGGGDVCSGRGLCAAATGECACVPGAFGDACEGECPGGVSPACGGHGTCDGESGRCVCDPTYAGEQCRLRVCLAECEEHGSCTAGTAECVCEAGWTGAACGEPEGAPAGNGTLHGVIGFTRPEFVAAEAGGTVTVSLTRSGGLAGAVRAEANTSDASAFAGIDYVPLRAAEVRWEDGEGGTRNLTVEVLDDGAAEQDETFGVYVVSVSGGAVAGGLVSTTVVIGENGEFDPGAVVEILVHLLDVDASREVGLAFAADVSESLGVSPARVSVLSVTPLGARAAEVRFEFLPPSPPGSGEGADDLAERFRRAMLEPDSALLAAPTASHVDVNFGAVVRTHRSDDGGGGGGGGGGSSTGLAVGLGVTFALLAAAGAACYVKRVPVTEWLLWRLGGFRFRTLHSQRQRAAEGGGGGAGAGGEDGDAGTYEFDGDDLAPADTEALNPEPDSSDYALGDTSLDSMPLGGSPL